MLTPKVQTNVGQANLIGINAMDLATLKKGQLLEVDMREFGYEDGVVLVMFRETDLEIAQVIQAYLEKTAPATSPSDAPSLPAPMISPDDL